MQTQKMEITVPAPMANFIIPQNKLQEDIRNAMILYPYIESGEITHGRAAELLGVQKWDLIQLYSSIGIPFINMTPDELSEELATVDNMMASLK